MTKLKKMKQNMILTDGTALKPSRGIFYVTLMCNLDCHMCFQQKHDRSHRELTLNEIRSIFTDISLSSLLLVGGEIFMRPDINEVLEFFNSRFSHISLQTNGSMITEDDLEQLKKLENIKDIWISVDGLGRNHDLIRGEGVFQQVIQVIEALKNDKNIYINTVILKENIHELEEIYRFFDNLGVHQITFQFQMAYTKSQYKRAKEQSQGMGLNVEIFNDCVSDFIDLEYATILKESIPRLQSCQNRTKIEFHPEVFVNHLDHYLNGNLQEDYKVLCADIVEPVLKIGPSGELLLCEAIKFSPGNLLDRSLDDMWNCSETKKIRMRLSEGNLLDMCSRCCCLDFI